jgi:hypothetical protein
MSGGTPGQWPVIVGCVAPSDGDDDCEVLLYLLGVCWCLLMGVCVMHVGNHR